MEDEIAKDYDLFHLEDEEIISRFLKRMIVNGDSLPGYFREDVDVFNRNPIWMFDSETPAFVIVKPRTDAYGKTDGCEAGCWRIIARDKLIKSKETGKILGVKKILKFSAKRKPREYKRIWVMEEYRLTTNLNWKQDHVICKIRLLFQTEICLLLAKHFKTTSESLLAYEMLLDYGYSEEDERYLKTIKDSTGHEYWPSYVTNKVYCLNPLMLVDPQDQMFRHYGICIFANETLGTTDKCDGGYWRIVHHDCPIKSEDGKIIGFKKVFQFHESEKQSSVREEEEYVKGTWTIEEYRLEEEVRQNKLLCLIKFTEDSLLARFF